MARKYWFIDTNLIINSIGVANDHPDAVYMVDVFLKDLVRVERQLLADVLRYLYAM